MLFEALFLNLTLQNQKRLDSFFTIFIVGLYMVSTEFPAILINRSETMSKASGFSLRTTGAFILNSKEICLKRRLNDFGRAES